MLSRGVSNIPKPLGIDFDRFVGELLAADPAPSAARPVPNGHAAGHKADDGAGDRRPAESPAAPEIPAELTAEAMACQRVGDSVLTGDGDRPEEQPEERIRSTGSAEHGFEARAALHRARQSEQAQREEQVRQIPQPEDIKPAEPQVLEKGDDKPAEPPPPTPPSDPSDREAVIAYCRHDPAFVSSPQSSPRSQNSASRAWRITSASPSGSRDETKFTAEKGRRLDGAVQKLLRRPRKDDPAGTPKWRERDKDGAPLPSLHNARLAIQAIGVECSHDTFHGHAVRLPRPDRPPRSQARHLRTAAKGGRCCRTQRPSSAPSSDIGCTVREQAPTPRSWGTHSGVEIFLRVAGHHPGVRFSFRGKLGCSGLCRQNFFWKFGLLGW